MAENEQQQKSEAAQAEEIQEDLTLLDQIIDEGKMALDESQRDGAKDILSAFVSQIMDGAMVVSKDTEITINNRISQIDKLISDQLNEIMHHEDFQKLEGSWRGLNYLVMQSETGESMKIRVLNASKKDLLKDLEKAAEFDQSTLFKKIYESEFGTFGGSAYGALIGDFKISNHPQDMSLIEKMSQVAAAAHAPFISAAAPELLGFDSFTQLGEPRDMTKIFQRTEYVKWRSFRESEDSRYVGLALPHILMRLPYGKENVPVEAFEFEEEVDGADHSKYLWGNAAYALGARLTDAFAKYHWCAAIRGVEGGGLVEGLPAHTFKTDEGAHYVGHNPAAAWMIILLLVSSIIICLTGYAACATKGKNRSLGFENTFSFIENAYADAEKNESHGNKRKGRERHSNREKEDTESDSAWSDIHEMSAQFMLMLTCLHIVGVAVSSKMHNENLAKSMVIGKKHMRF